MNKKVAPQRQSGRPLSSATRDIGAGPKFGLPLQPRAVTRQQLLGTLLLAQGSIGVLIILFTTVVFEGWAGSGNLEKLLLLATGVSWISGVALSSRLPFFRQQGWLQRRITVDPGELLVFAAVTGEVVGVVFIARGFELESAAFYAKILPLTAVGFVLSHFLPAGIRLRFFVLLSLSGLLWVFGLTAGLWLIAAGVLLIAVCHLPIAFRSRVLLLIGFSAILAALRSRVIEASFPAAIWPILGSMFMFRLIAYMYHLRHSKEQPSWARASAYFFLLPNVVFPLFPVVDYATFRRTYFDQDALLIYQRGIAWITIGMLHLLLYRVVYQNWAIAPSEVSGFSSALQYFVANFSLYLRVSGQFHLIVGMLHLFGFRLPETHRFYFLASSFTDFWRRINIYWKDFMMKVVYYPVYFRVRRWREAGALVAATVSVFCVTWALHSYQWFWLLGHVLLSPTDVLFWGILALLLVLNTLREVKRGRSRAIGVARRSWRMSFALSSRILFTFATLSVLWSLWTSPTFSEWLALLSAARPKNRDYLLLSAVMTGAIVLIAAADQVLLRRGKPMRSELLPTRFARSLLMNATTVIALAFLASPAAMNVFEQLAPKSERLLSALRAGDLNAQDAALLRRGYYENLTGLNRFNSQLWQIYSNNRPPKDWKNSDAAGITRLTSDHRVRELIPGARATFHRAQFTVNRWGMRDRDYALAPPQHTYRMALLGQSYVMGSGVADDETFESVLEDRLNRDREPANSGLQYEILNFSVLSYSPPQLLWTLENKALVFQPNAAIYVAYWEDADQAVAYLAMLVRQHIRYPYSFLEATARRAGVTADMPREEVIRHLNGYRYQLLADVYSAFVQRCRSANIIPVWLYLAPPDFRPDPITIRTMKSLAGRAGFEVLDLSNVYVGQDTAALHVAPWDRHPNATGHRLIADRLYTLLAQRGDLLGRQP